MTYKEANKIFPYAIFIIFIFLIIFLFILFRFTNWFRDNIELMMFIGVMVIFIGWIFVFFIINKAHEKKKKQEGNDE